MLDIRPAEQHELDALIAAAQSQVRDEWTGKDGDGRVLVTYRDLCTYLIKPLSLGAPGRRPG